MSAVVPEPGKSPAARLLERERNVDSLESGRDLLIEETDCLEQWALAVAALQFDPARLGLLLLPDLDHPLSCLAAAPGAISVSIVAPDMSEAGRRDLGIALRNQTVQLLAVTPERLAQPRFVQFIRAQHPTLLAVAAVQRLCADRPDYTPAYESLRALRALFPAVPILALADEPLSRHERSEIGSAMALQVGTNDTEAPDARVAKSGASLRAPEEAAPEPSPTISTPVPPARGARPAFEEFSLQATASPRPEPGPPSSATAPPAPASAPPPGRSLRPPAPPAPVGAAGAFALFAREATLDDVGRALGRDEDWVHRALAAYIRHSGRTHPFPWIDKPVYLCVSMAAGQAESTNPRLIASVLNGQIAPGIVEVVLAALDNRQQGRC